MRRSCYPKVSRNNLQMSKKAQGGTKLFPHVRQVKALSKQKLQEMSDQRTLLKAF